MSVDADPRAALVFTGMILTMSGGVTLLVADGSVQYAALRAMAIHPGIDQLRDEALRPLARAEAVRHPRERGDQHRRLSQGPRPGPFDFESGILRRHLGPMDIGGLAAVRWRRRARVVPRPCRRQDRGGTGLGVGIRQPACSRFGIGGRIIFSGV